METELVLTAEELYTLRTKSRRRWHQLKEIGEIEGFVLPQVPIEALQLPVDLMTKTNDALLHGKAPLRLNRDELEFTHSLVTAMQRELTELAGADETNTQWRLAANIMIKVEKSIRALDQRDSPR